MRNSCLFYQAYLLIATILAGTANAAVLHVEVSGGVTELRVDSSPPFHATEATVSDAELIELTGPALLIAHWRETVGTGSAVPHYSFGPDGEQMAPVHLTSHTLHLRYSGFDPLDGVPTVPQSLTADPSSELYAIQFFTMPLARYRDEIESFGGVIHGFVASNALVVQMDASAKAQFEQAGLAYVRWHGPLHPAYRISNFIRDNLESPSVLFPDHRYVIRVFEPGPTRKGVVADRITTLGGSIDVMGPQGPLLQATLTPEQLLAVISWDEVAFVEPWLAEIDLMDVVRQISGADYVETFDGYTGHGVRGQVMDNWLKVGHPAFQSRPAIIQGVLEEEALHGTAVYGIVFGDGTDAPRPGVKGMLPDGQGIFNHYRQMSGWGITPVDGISRDTFTCQLVAETAEDCQACCEQECSNPNCVGEDPPRCSKASDPVCCEAGPPECCLPDCCPSGCERPECDFPDCCPWECFECLADAECPYNVVLQNNSWGSPSDEQYSPRCAEFDDILFRYDLLACQGLGNSGDNDPTGHQTTEGWAKNAVTVGGVWHFDSPDKDNHVWHNEAPGPHPLDASIGPAWDGRIKPDLVHVYDLIATTCSIPGEWECTEDLYTDDPSPGTSGTTPIVSGHFGILFQMWDEGVFRKVCDGSGQNCDVSGGAGSVFDSRPHMTTAKAIMINTAEQYPMPLGASDDLSRTHQGWGMPDLSTLHALALNDRFLLIIDEARVLENEESAVYSVEVPEGAAALKVTMVYADPAPQPPIPPDLHTVNDLNLKVTAPSDPPNPDAVYWGNCGLRDGIWSTECEAPNPPEPLISPTEPVRDTVENVFISNPLAGTWTIEVDAAEIVEDGHIDGTPEEPLDASFALVVSVDVDCQPNGVLDSQEILSDDAINDCNGNGIPDDCEVQAGVPFRPALPKEAQHQARKNRYLSINPNMNCLTPVAIKVMLSSMKRCSGDLRRACVTDSDCPGVCSLNHDLQCTGDAICGPDGPCVPTSPCVEHPDVGSVVGYVDEPYQKTCLPLHDCTDQWFAHLGSDPLYRVWTEGTLHITDCPIVPVAEYEILATPDGLVFSDVLTIGTIAKPNVHYGDCVGPIVEDAYTPPDGFTNVTDVQAYLIANRGGATAPHTTWVDLHGGPMPVVPQQILNVADLQTIKFAFLGNTYTETPGQAYPSCCPIQGQDDPCDIFPDTMSSSGTFTLVPNNEIIDPEGSVVIDVYIDPDADFDLGAYELALEVTGGTGGTLLLQDITVDDQRSNYVFTQQNTYDSTNDIKASLSNTPANVDDVTVQGLSYLATYTYQAAEGASGVFTVSVKGDGASFLNDGQGLQLSSDPGETELIGVGIDCFDDADCATLTCKTVACVDYACIYTDASQGTPCDDGLFCTATDECDGNGTCTGSGSPCTIFQICLEHSDRCVYPPPP